MEQSLNFRVKVDLSSFYHDMRKLSYIFIDGSKITNILHLQTKIQNIFGITRPFYLVVNDVFLPVNEDVRIIKDDEVVIMRPGYAGGGWEAGRDIFEIPEYDEIRAELKPQYPSDSTLDTDVEICDQSKVDTSINDVQIIDDKVIPQKKRKRVRRRKPKKEETNEPLTLTKNPLHNGYTSTNYQATKINLGDNKPTPRHLKFNWDEPEEPEKKVNGTSIPLSSKPVVRSSEITSLSTLLNLRNSQRPVTFSGQRRSRTNSTTSLMSKVSTKNHESPERPELMDVSLSKTPQKSNNNIPSDTIDYSKINISVYPIHKGEFEPDDVIAFKILTMNENYCPVLSDFIVAKIVSKNFTNNYSCKILVGQDQLKTPDGKFALPTDEEESEEMKVDNQDLITLNATHLDQPRLIYRHKMKE